jgi:hypothetical protein
MGGRWAAVVAILLGGLGVALLGVGVWGTFLRSPDRSGNPAAAARAAPPTDGRSATETATATPRGTTTATPSPATPQPATPTGTAPPVPTGGGSFAAPSPTPLPLPTVLDVVVCDATVDCGLDPAQTVWFEVTACLRTSSAGSERPLVLVVTGRDAPPVGRDDPWVFARSDAIRATESLTCHPVRVVGAPLIQREYWLWVLADETVLRKTRFTFARP